MCLEHIICLEVEFILDGNEFCVATNEKYTVLDYCLYGERLMVFAAEVIAKIKAKELRG